MNNLGSFDQINVAIWFELPQAETAFGTGTCDFPSSTGVILTMLPDGRGGLRSCRLLVTVRTDVENKMYRQTCLGWKMWSKQILSNVTTFP